MNERQRSTAALLLPPNERKCQAHPRTQHAPGIVQFAAQSDTMLRQYVFAPVANGIFSPPTDHLSDAALVPGCRIVCLRRWHCCRLILLPPTRLPPPPPGGCRLHAAFPTSPSSSSISFSPSLADCASCFQSICHLHRSLALPFSLFIPFCNASFFLLAPRPLLSSLLPFFRFPPSESPLINIVSSCFPLCSLTLL